MTVLLCGGWKRSVRRPAALLSRIRRPRSRIRGEVVSVGKGKIKEDGSVRALDLKKGDRILFGKYAGTAVKIDGEELLVMREDDVMAVFE